MLVIKKFSRQHFHIAKRLIQKSKPARMSINERGVAANARHIRKPQISR